MKKVEKVDCIYCGHKDNEVHLLKNYDDLDWKNYDWYLFDCRGCNYMCSFSVKKEK